MDEFWLLKPCLRWVWLPRPVLPRVWFKPGLRRVASRWISPAFQRRERSAQIMRVA